jgi:pimeloyl-ACP methyl ester carboxylesterase
MQSATERLGGPVVQIRKIALLLAACVVVAVAGTPPGMPDGWSDGYVYANGIRIHYYRAAPAPGKPVMVMAHDFSDYGLNWTTLTEDLQDDYDIYMVDARGHGYTDPPTADGTGDAAVEDLVGFLREMKIEKPILMGHSMGAATVMRIGRRIRILQRRSSCSIRAWGCRERVGLRVRHSAARRRKRGLRRFGLRWLGTTRPTKTSWLSAGRGRRCGINWAGITGLCPRESSTAPMHQEVVLQLARGE